MKAASFGPYHSIHAVLACAGLRAVKNEKVKAASVNPIGCHTASRGRWARGHQENSALYDTVRPPRNEAKGRLKLRLLFPSPVTSPHHRQTAYRPTPVQSPSAAPRPATRADIDSAFPRPVCSSAAASGSEFSSPAVCRRSVGGLGVL